MITFDFSGYSTDLIGDKGIALSDIEALAPKTQSAHQTIMEKRLSGEIGFYDLPLGREVAEKVKQTAAEIGHKFKNVVNIGIGGSSLGPKTAFSALKDPLHNLHSEPRMFFPDNVDPEYMHSLLSHINVSETPFLIVSKSGTTAEPAAQFMIVLDLLKKALGNKYKDNLIFVTDPVKGVLRKLARNEGIRTLEIPPEIGGRFSVLTPVGLLPAALCGIDIDELLSGAAAMADIALREDIFENPPYLYGICHYLAMVKGHNISVLMPYANALYDMADWYRQLWAESLGKKNSLDGRSVYTGQTPVKALGATDQHSQVQLDMEGPYDKIINIMTVKNYRNDITMPQVMDDIPEVAYLCGKNMSELINAEAKGTMAALISNQRMTGHIALDTIDARTIGALFMFFEAATAFTGYLLNINPFDQPGVELGKINTFSLMGREGFEDRMQMPAKVAKMSFEI